MFPITRTLDRYLLSERLGLPRRRYLARPFPRHAARRVAIYYEPNRIAFAQIYPFLHYAAEIERRHGAVLRLVSMDALRAGAAPLAGADTVIAQLWWTTEAAEGSAILERLRAATPEAHIAYFDPGAHTDLRQGAWLDPWIDSFHKKSIFRDPEQWFRTFLEDTNLTDFYVRHYGLEGRPVDWQAPRSMLPKLNVSPGFLMAPTLLPLFAGRPMPIEAGQARPIDLHIRLGVKGSPWYREMREEWLSRSRAIVARRPGLRMAEGRGVSWKVFMEELYGAKIVLSPFGFGELCWRDMEAFATGAVLVKQDMSHLETLPDLYVDGETYVACRWDLSDLEETIEALLDDPDRRVRIARTAFERARAYIDEARFVDDMTPLLTGQMPLREAPAA
ncbi:MAG: glycosyltransferase [Pseudomonadota bacterium]